MNRKDKQKKKKGSKKICIIFLLRMYKQRKSSIKSIIEINQVTSLNKIPK